MSEANQPTPEVPQAPVISMPLTAEQRMRLARGILDRTCIEVNAGYLLVMFLPGTDLMLRSFRGLDTPLECVAASKEVTALLAAHIKTLTGEEPKALHNEN